MEKSGKGKLILRVFIIFLLIGTAAFGISRLNIETPDEHKEISENGSLSVTIRINCETIFNKDIKDKKHFVENGIILDWTKYMMSDGDTAFDVLNKAIRDNDIQMEYTGGKNPYVEGINYLYEFDYGKLSGWMYKVNDEYFGTGCGSYRVKDGDKVEFLYTCDLGRDIGNEYKE